MKLVMVRQNDGQETAGCLIGDEVLDFVRASESLGSAPAARTVVEILDERSNAAATARSLLSAVQNGEESTRAALRKSGALLPLKAVKLGAPLPQPRNIFAHGQAYQSHLRDWHPDKPPVLPAHPPAGFLKSPTAVIGTGDAIRIPKLASELVDYEGELCVVFGRECHRVSRDKAMDYVAGYTIINDVSARDWGLFVLKNPEARAEPAYSALNVMYKNFPTFCPQGPNVTTKDEIPDHRQMRLLTRLNGEVMQDTLLSDLIWDIPELIERYSAIIRFEPGDIMSTGTPGGVGAGRKPPVFLKNGDIIEVEVQGVGVLKNPVVGP